MYTYRYTRSYLACTCRIQNQPRPQTTPSFENFYDVSPLDRSIDRLPEDIHTHNNWIMNRKKPAVASMIDAKSIVEVHYATYM